MQGQVIETPIVRFSDIKHLRILYWCVAIHTGLGYYNWTSFNYQIPDILEKNFGITGNLKGRLNSIPFFICFITPLWGALIDKFGKKVYILMFASIICLLCHISFLLIPKENCGMLPIIPLIGLGLYLSF